MLLDDASRESRREAAKAVGAAGYVVNPLAMKDFVTRLAQLVEAPSDRRFKRYSQRLTARFLGASQPCLVTDVSRGGIFVSVSTQHAVEAHTAMPCEVALAKVGKSLKFEGEVVYIKDAQGGLHQGLGLRIFDMSSEDEATLIEYVQWLESSI